MFTRVLERFGLRAPIYRPMPQQNDHKVVITENCIAGIQACLELARKKRHEGIGYLYGLATDSTTLVIGCVRPQATTTRGSFLVESVAMAKIVRMVASSGLQLVGQIHTHPGAAYHSDGDVDGARLAFSGYVSIVLPNYGDFLPSLKGAAIYAYKNPKGFIDIEPDQVAIVKSHVA